MTYIIEIISLRLISIIGLTPLQRLNALKSTSNKKPSDNNGLIWLMVMAVIICLAIVIRKIIQIWKRKAERTANWAFFNSRTKEMGLEKNEIEILLRMIKLMDLDHEPHSVLTVENDFRSGFEKYLENELSSDSSDHDKAEYEQKIDQLQAKMGFDHSAVGGEQSSRGQIREGTNVSVTVVGLDGDFPATVQQCNMENLTFKLKPELANSCSPGDKWLITFIDNKSLWKFETSVISKKDDLVFLENVDKMQFVNLRRFDRVPVEQRALLGKFLFHTNDHRVTPPNFAEAKIVEIAGPGLRIRIPQTLHIGERILVILEVEQRRIIQVVGIIRNSYKSNGLHREYGVELVGLSPTEVSEVVEITKEASDNSKKSGNKANWKEDKKIVTPAA